MASLNPSTSKPTLKDLMDDLASVSSKYFKIGIQLGVPENKIEGFEKSFPEDVDRRFYKVLSHWQKGNTDMPVNWGSIIKVLRSNSVAEKDLADELHRKHKEDARNEATDQSQSDPGYGSQVSQTSTVTGTVESVDRDTCASPSFPQPLLKLTDKHKSDARNETPDQSQSDPGYESQVSQTRAVTETVEMVDTSLTAPPPPVKPLYELINGCTKKTPKRVLDTLTKFGHSSFRPGQEKAVMNILSGVSTLVIQPIGSGKSLCYQLPAYLYAKSRSPCITLVISPLISLMEDQVLRFPCGLKGACLHANQTQSKKKKVMDDVVKGKVHVLLISAEALVGGTLWTGFGGSQYEGNLPPVAFACIDEIHCVSEWSHNFRFAYFQIEKVLREKFGVHCVLGLTATATHKTAVSVATHFNIEQDNILNEGNIVPDNLHLSVSCDDDKDKALRRLLQSSKFNDFKSMIIYCTSRKETERITEMLREKLPFNWSDDSESESEEDDSDSEAAVNSKKRKKRNTSVQSKRYKREWNIKHYHAGMKGSDRQKVQDDFMEDKVNIVVATVAFGMGLNKSDVRAIIHYNMPKSFESFVQEIGRAGRDGQPAFCHVFIDKKGSDIYELRRYAYNSTTDINTLKKLVEKVFPYCKCTSPEVAASLPFSTSNSMESLSVSQESQKRSAGHKVTIHVEEMEESMDIYRESISTLLCYLELENKLKITSVIRGTCVLRFPLGESQLRAFRLQYPIVAKAMLSTNVTTLDQSDTTIKFIVEELAQSIEERPFSVYSQLCKLRSDQEALSVNNPINSVSVELSSHQFHIQSHGVASHKEHDDICKFLAQKVEEQEEKQVEKVHVLHAVLSAVSKPSDSDKSGASMTETDSTPPILVKMINMYFGSKGLDLHDLEEKKIGVFPIIQSITPGQQKKVESNAQSLILLLCQMSMPFNERTVARIFQGIQSPLFPAIECYACGYWKKHKDTNFYHLCHHTSKKL